MKNHQENVHLKCLGPWFAEGIIIDQHFAQGRMADCCRSSQNPEVLGIGIDEYGYSC